MQFLMPLMFMVAGVATLLIGFRARTLGVPPWLGRLIFIAGALMALTGMAGLFFPGA